MTQKILAYFGTLIFLILTSTYIHATPKLTAEKSVFNFGTIREGANATVKFKITNTGSKKVQIQEIRTFAACVESGPLPRHHLQPGESLELEYVFESLGYGGASVDKKIEVHYNNPTQSPLQLRVKGKVLALESYQAPLGELTYNFFVLIDIRPQKNFVKEHIIGAINVPVEKISEWAAKASKNISGELIIYLYSEDGNKSDETVKMLRKKGFSQCISIVGGLKEWKHQYGDKFLVSGKW